MANTILSRALVTRDQFSRRYCSRYFGKRVANEDSSVKGFWFSSLVKGSTFHCVYNVSYFSGSLWQGIYVIDVICVPWFWLSVAFVLVNGLRLSGDLGLFSHLVLC